MLNKKSYLLKIALFLSLALSPLFFSNAQETTFKDVSEFKQAFEKAKEQPGVQVAFVIDYNKEKSERVRIEIIDFGNNTDNLFAYQALEKTGLQRVYHPSYNSPETGIFLIGLDGVSMVTSENGSGQGWSFSQWDNEKEIWYNGEFKCEVNGKLIDCKYALDDCPLEDGSIVGLAYGDWGRRPVDLKQ